ncbi:MAG: hypothetical protein Q8P61_03515 [Candidatus Nanopelagicales bacterium]|nr:hypothetical protein [Candidatus Nanopelagicales bacterium]
MRTIRPGPRRSRVRAVREALAPGERLFSWAETSRDFDEVDVDGTPAADTGYLVVTDRRFLVLGLAGPMESIAWERVMWARWNPPVLTLAGQEPGSAEPGAPMRESTVRFRLASPGNVPAHVHERIEATIVVQRRVSLVGGIGARLVARRRPLGREVSWHVVFDQGTDNGDPVLRRDAEQELAQFRDSVGI